jgi:hypothetical protein
MDSFLANVGMLAIAFAIIYIYMKILEWHDDKYSGFYEDEKVYQAANEFVRGVPADDVKALLAGCFNFDEGDAEEIISMSVPHRNDKDGGYKAFIRSVNKVLGEDVYNEKRHAHGTL